MFPTIATVHLIRVSDLDNDCRSDPGSACAVKMRVESRPARVARADPAEEREVIGLGRRLPFRDGERGANAVISILGTIMLATIIGIAMLDRASGLTLLEKYVAPRAGVPRAASSTIRHRAGDPPPPASAV
jgi:hypothetical protein